MAISKRFDVGWLFVLLLAVTTPFLSAQQSDETEEDKAEGPRVRAFRMFSEREGFLQINDRAYHIDLERRSAKAIGPADTSAITRDGRFALLAQSNTEATTTDLTLYERTEEGFERRASGRAARALIHIEPAWNDPRSLFCIWSHWRPEVQKANKTSTITLSPYATSMLLVYGEGDTASIGDSPVPRLSGLSNVFSAPAFAPRGHGLAVMARLSELARKGLATETQFKGVDGPLLAFQHLIVINNAGELRSWPLGPLSSVGNPDTRLHFSADGDRLLVQGGFMDMNGDFKDVRNQTRKARSPVVIDCRTWELKKDWFKPWLPHKEMLLAASDSLKRAVSVREQEVRLVRYDGIPMVIQRIEHERLEGHIKATFVKETAYVAEGERVWKISPSGEIEEIALQFPPIKE